MPNAGHIPTPGRPDGPPAGGRPDAPAARIAALAAPCAEPAAPRPLPTPAEADRGQPLHQRHAALLGVVVGEFAALRLDLVLRRQRQFVDARHARRTHGGALGRRRDEGFRHRRFGMRRFAGRRFEQRRLHRHRPDRDLLDRGRRQHRGGNRGMRGRFDRNRRRCGAAARPASAPTCVRCGRLCARRAPCRRVP